MDRFGFLKVAAAIPHLRVGDCDYNAGRMTALAEEAAQRGAEIVVFPELSLTGYTCGDLLLQPALLDAAEETLEGLVRATRKLPLALIAGAPLRHGETLFNLRHKIQGWCDSPLTEEGIAQARRAGGAARGRGADRARRCAQPCLFQHGGARLRHA